MKKGQNGSGLISVLTGRANKNDKDESDSKLPPVERAIKSEAKLINTYEDLAKVSKKYYDRFDRHLKNLITLDDINGMTPGLVHTFRNVIVKNEFKGKDNINRSNPLLLRNYAISPHTIPRIMRREHLMQQIRYKLSQFNPKDALLFDSVDVSLSGKTATVLFRAINGDKYERTNKVSDEYALDLSKLQSDIKDVIASIKKKMDYEIEIMDDFELAEEDIEIPGLQFMDEQDGIEARLKALELGKSIRPADADVDTLSEAEEKAKERDPPKRDVIFDTSEQEPVYRPRPSIAMDREEDIGIDQGFGTDRQLEMKPPDIDAQLAKYFDDNVAPGAGMEHKPRGAFGDNRKRSILKARERRFGSESKSQGRNANNVGELDPLESKCREITDEDQCKRTLGCYYNKKHNKCHRDLKMS